MTQVVCTDVTLTDTFGAMNDSPVALEVDTKNSGSGELTLLVKYVKDGAPSGGYPVIRLVWGYYLEDGAAAQANDPQPDPNLSVASGVVTIDLDTNVSSLKGLTDSDGARWYPVPVSVPKWATTLYALEAKQAGDTTNFGTLSAQLAGKV